MSDAPERIWITTNDPCFRPYVTRGYLASPPRTGYVRADLHAALEAQLAEAKDALGWALKQLDNLEDFHDSDTKPCCEYGAECPISMGEWFDDDDRGKLKKAHAALAKVEQNENEP